MNFKPDVSLADNENDNTNLLKRERADWIYNRDPERVTAGTAREIGQILVNIDHVLDNYPLGMPRNEVTVEQAHRIAQVAQVPRLALAA